MDTRVRRISARHWIAGAALLGLCVCSGCGQAPEELADAALKKGDEHMEKDELDKAISAYSEAVKLYPKEAKDYKNKQRDYRYARAVAYHKKGELEKAYTDYTEAFPFNQKAYCGRGRVWLEMDEKAREKKTWDAAHDFKTAIGRAEELNEEYPEAYYYLGVALKEKGQTEDAERCFAKAAELGYEPEEPEADGESDE